jgi:hypothetical protein
METWRETESRSRTRTRKQTLTPVHAWREIVASVQFLTSEEQIMEQASDLANLATGKSIVHVSGRGVGYFLFPLAKEPFRRLPRLLATKREQFRRAQLLLPCFITPPDFQAYRQTFLRALLEQLHRIPRSDQCGVALPSPSTVVHSALPGEEQPLLPNVQSAEWLAAEETADVPWEI